MNKKKRSVRIVKTPPGPASNAIHEIESRLISHSISHLYEISPIHVERARGSLVEDVDKNVYLDFSSGVVVTSTGHCHPKVVKAIKDQAEKVIFSYVWGVPARSRLLEKLVEISPRGMDKALLLSTGSEANEAAIKLSKAYTKRAGILSFYGGYHGLTLAVASAAGSFSPKKLHYPALAPGYVQMPYPYCYRCDFGQEYPGCSVMCLDYIKNVMKRYESTGHLAGILVEPIQGPNACIVPPDEFLPELRSMADEYGCLLMVDEVQTFPGRTGKMFAVEHVKVKPDILIVAKGMASGLPMSAVISTSKIMNIPEWGWGSASSTYGGSPIPCAAALATLETVIEEKMVENAAKIGHHMRKRLLEMMGEHEIIGSVNGKGLLIGVELVKDRKTKEPDSQSGIEVIKRAFKKGLILLYSGLYSTHVIKITPPLNITMEEADEGLDILDEAIREARPRK
jgi:4-aminobutyrate aminotransferase